MGIGLVYTAFYCAVCASSAKLDVLLSSEPRATWTRRLRWRATIAWLNFLEPFARDWGRLKGGLTPWRSAFPGALPKCQATSWWQRLQPFRRTAHWSFPGNMALEKFAILSALTGRSNRHGYAVGWNPSHADWDIRIRRGALVEAYARTVVEHHGGSRRLARFMAVIRPTKSVNWLLGSICSRIPRGLERGR